VIDIDLRGGTADIVARLAAQAEPTPAEEKISPSPDDGRPKGRGRPKLGVVAREVTLLPRHWEWLSAQPGGASVTLRRLVETARRTAGENPARVAQERAYRFLNAIAGNLPAYEEALRALFAHDGPRFAQVLAGWPEDIRTHALALAAGAFASESTP